MKAVGEETGFIEFRILYLQDFRKHLGLTSVQPGLYNIIISLVFSLDGYDKISRKTWNSVVRKTGRTRLSSCTGGKKNFQT